MITEEAVTEAVVTVTPTVYPELLPHQTEVLEFLQNQDKAVVNVDMGLGKTGIVSTEAFAKVDCGLADAAVAVVPKALLRNWCNEISKFCRGVEHIKVILKSGMKKAEKEAFQAALLTKKPVFFIVCMESLVSAQFREQVDTIYSRFSRVLMIVDESHRCGNHTTIRTKSVAALAQRSAYVRLLTGTFAHSPKHVFSQMQLVNPKVFGHSYYAFLARYAVLLPSEHPLVKAASKNSKFPPQIIARDNLTGAPLFRNLDEMHQKLQPYMIRRTKAECLSLPEKIYVTRGYTLTPAQKQHFLFVLPALKETLKADGKDRAAALVVLRRSMQCLNNYDDLGQKISETNPKLNLLLDLVQDFDFDQSLVIWASEHNHVNDLKSALEDLRIGRVAEFTGRTSIDERNQAVEDFEAGKVRFFVATQAAAGVGLTLVRASAHIFYSNTFSYTDRVQAEDRSHRIGQNKSVVYFDLLCEDTKLEQRVLDILQSKGDVASLINDGDLK